MNISDERLREIVARVLREVQAEAEGAEVPGQKSVYVICLEDWDSRYGKYLASIKAEAAGRVKLWAVVPPAWRENGREEQLKAAFSCGTMTYTEAENAVPGDRDVTVYPVVPPYLLAKAALCIDDIFPVRWLSACIGRGSRVIFLKTGLTRFTGREPKAYQARRLSYIRDILDYGVELAAGGMQEPEERAGREPEERAGREPEEREYRNENSVEYRKRVITARDVEGAAVRGVLTLYPGDQITDVARDRAKFLKIAVKRADTP